MLRRSLLLLIPVCVVGCASNMSGKYVVQEENRLIEVPSVTASDTPVLAPLPIEFEDISLEDKARSMALTRAQLGDKALDLTKSATADVIIQPDNARLYPFGLAQAQLTCFKMLVSNILLEENERVQDMVAGDTVRWQTKVSYVGTAEKFVPVVMVKPFIGGLTTNLSIITDKRQYNVILTSIEQGDYMPGIGFYYPQDVQEKNKIPAPPMAKLDPTDMMPFDVENIKFSYVMEGDKTLPWYPVSVFDDGTKVFIKMGTAVRSSELPVFLVRDARGRQEVVNYRYKKPYYIVDQIFQRGELILGVDSNQTKIVIRKK